MTSDLSSVAELAPNRLGETVGTYAIAYLDAAAVLLRHGAAGRGFQDLCFYPAAHNLRHGLELIAKQISDYTAYELRDASLLYQPGHSLKKAWENGPTKMRTLLSDDDYAESPGDVRRAMQTLDALISRLDVIDPSGTLFRYPENVFIKKKPTGVPAVDRDRVDQHVTDNRVDLSVWAGYATEALEAAQTLRYYFDQRTSFLRHRRGDPPASLADLTTGKITDAEKDDYRRRVQWRPGMSSAALAMIELTEALRADGADVALEVHGPDAVRREST